ncbi:hypothetical protein, partial [Micromonospora sp. NPDC049679]|uniref:hypothetical protein n=1 Tax=Micromonospora sp. NPDC049679 TaxID=3155920 RepID=UPI0033CAA6C0
TRRHRYEHGDAQRAGHLHHRGQAERQCQLPGGRPAMSEDAVRTGRIAGRLAISGQPIGMGARIRPDVAELALRGHA